MPRKWALRESILTALDSGKPVEEGEVVDAAPWCISCGPVQMRMQMQSLDAASCTPGGNHSHPHHTRHSVEASHCSTWRQQGRTALLFMLGSYCIA